MKTICVFFFLLTNCFLYAQPAQDKAFQERQAKLDLILRYKDTRTIYDGKLVSLLRDEDREVRRQAVLAYGSLQDTSVMPQLVELLNDPEPGVQVAAAFAIGQTAGFVSKRNRDILEHDLLWARMAKMSTQGNPGPADRLIEEIGKFGSSQALNDLIQQFGSVYPQVHQKAIIMSIARFGIRNISSTEAVQYLLKLTMPPEATDWHVMYALQRIGDHKEIRSKIDHIVKLYTHTNPLVRMNLATLLGKLKDELTSLEPLQKLAEYDGDWRVRVNALKALGNFNLNAHEELVQTFRRSFYHENKYVALTALSTFGNTNAKKDSTPALKEAFAALEKIAENAGNGYLWQLQAEAATALAKLEGAKALPFIAPTDFPQPLLQAQLLTAQGLTGSVDALPMLTKYLGSDSPLLYRAALDGMQELSNRNPSNKNVVQATFNASIKALDTRDMAVRTTAASILGDSLFQSPSAVAPLIQTFENLRLPDDVEVMQEIASTLGKLKDVRAIDVLKNQLDQPDQSVALASAAALKSITGQDYKDAINRSIQPRYQDLDFAYLHTLPDTVKVKLETIRGDVTMALYKNAAPFTVMNILKLATQRGYYRGLTFHRVVPNFVVQGGDPRGDGWGGPGFSIRSEFSPLTYETGTLGIASSGKDTEGSQFFVTQSPQPHLDGRYTIFGKVITGMDIVDRILVGDHMYDIKIIQ